MIKLFFNLKRLDPDNCKIVYKQQYRACNKWQIAYNTKRNIKNAF